MDIKQNNPLGVPIIGTAQIIATVAVITLRCVCKNIIMGQMGIPLPCTQCKKVWFVSATSQIKVQEVLSDIKADRKLSLCD